MTTDALARPVHSGLVLSPRPFAREEEVTLHALPDGMTLLAMVERLETLGALDPALRPWVRVTLGEARIDRALWSRIRPKAGVTVFIDVAPMAKSNAVRTLLQVAVIALSAFVGGAIGGMGGALAAAAINVGGMMLINAIAPIKQPEMTARQERYSLSGGSNAAAPHEAWPIVLGRRRIFPRRCANWYTQTVNNTVYLRMMFQAGISWVDHAQPRLGQTSLDSFDEVTVRWRTRPDEAIAPLYFDRTPVEDSLGLAVSSAAGWVTRSAPIAADALSIDIAFMAGLFETKESSGNPKSRSVTFEFRYGPKGGDPATATACPFTVGGLLTFTRDKLDTWREGHEWAVDLGEYDVHMRRVSAETINNPKISDELTWVCLRAFRNQAPVRDLTGKPWIEIEMKATEQLNGVPDDFNFIATSMAAQATADGPGELIATRNPADLFLATSYPPFSDIELDDDERDFVALAAWRETCQDQGWTCDLVEASELSVGELMQRVAACGRARPTLDFGALSVVVDWEKPYPRQMFTPRNVQGFTGDLTFPTELHALRVRFQNQDKDYDDDTITVFAEGYDLDTATLYESLDVRDKTDPDAVEWEGARVLAERLLRPETFTFEQDVEYLTIGEGDRALLAHHVALVGQISGRVMARVVDAQDAAHRGLKLDERVVMEPGRSYDLAWRPSADADIVTFALETVAGQDDVVWFAAPAPDVDNQPRPGDLISVFEHAVELLDVIVNRISPKAGLKAELSCVPYAPQLQHIGEDPIDSYRTGASRPPGLGGALVERRSTHATEAVLRAIGEALSVAGGNLETAQGAIVDLGDQVGAVQELRDAVEAISGPGGGDLAERARDRIAQIYVQADLTAEAILRQALTSVDDRAYQEAMTYLDGVPVGVVVRNEQIRTDTAITNLSLVTVRVGTAEGAIVTETSARIAGDAAEASARTILAARVTTAEAAIVAEATTRASADTAEASARVTLAARVTTAEGAIVTEQTARANADSAEATARLALAARTTAAEAAIVSNYSTLADADDAEATARLALAARTTAAEAAIVTEQTTRANADSALTSITTSQGSRLTTAEATIVSNYTTLAAADAALSVITTSLTSRMGSAESSITSNYSTLVTADAALAARSEVLEATATAALNPNDRFGTWPAGQTFPTHWANGANATSNIAKVTGGLSPNGKRLVGPAGVDVYDQTSALFALPPGWYVLSAHVTLNSGALTGSGVVLNAFAAGPSYLTAYSLQFAVDGDINETVLGAGTAGKSYIFAKLIQVTPATAALGNLYCCAHNSGLGSISGANSVTFHQVAIRPASSAEVAGKRASADVVTATARIATEETVRASGDGALAVRATNLEAQMANSSGSGLSARIATEEGVRLTNDNALAVRATNLEAQMANSSGSGLQSRIATEESARATAVATVASSVTSLTSTVNGHTATITTQAGTLADLSGKLLAYAKWTAAAGGNEAYVELVAANDGSLLNLVAKSIRLGAGGTPVIIVEGGVAKMTNVEISGSLLLGNSVVSGALALGATAETAGAPASGSWTGEGWSQRASTTITGAANEVMMLYPSGSVVTNGGTTVDIQDCEWQIKRNGAVIYGPLYTGSGSLGRDAGSGQNARLTTAIQGAYRDAAPAVGSNVYTLEVRVTGDGGAPTRTGTDMALFAVRLKRQA